VSGVETKLDWDAGIAALTYIAQHDEVRTLHSVFKALYAAEKLHLSRYADTMVGDRFIAIEYGPVPSALYDLLKALSGGRRASSVDPERARSAARFLEVSGYHVRAKADPDRDELSDAAVECLDDAIRELAGMTYGQRVDWSHDAAWRRAPENGTMTWDAIISTLDNADVIAEHVRDPYPD
jgi:hypothetical protein